MTSLRMHAGTASPVDEGPVAFLGDSHLVADEPASDAFLEFLERAPGRLARLALLGDVFDLWLARPHLHEEHHRRVLEGVARARGRGLQVDYAVGNRDFGVESWSAAPFDRIAIEVLVAPGASPAWVAEHGDLVNEDDLQYRRWRSFARSRPVLGSFLALPARVGVPVSLWLERRMRTTNLAYKRRFPQEHAQRRAAAHFRATGARLLVLGHFHEERRFPAPGGEVVVLPDWKRSRRHAEWRPGPHDGAVAVVDSLTG